MNPDQLLAIDLTSEERFVLRCGLVEWGGPSRCTEEMAIAMGFAGVDDLFANTDRLVAVIMSGGPLSATDWCRVVLATEVVFASDLLGSGLDWSSTTGLSDDDTLRTLRRLQRKVPPQVRSVIGKGVGTLPDRRSAGLSASLAVDEARIRTTEPNTRPGDQP